MGAVCSKKCRVVSMAGLICYEKDIVEKKLLAILLAARKN